MKYKSVYIISILFISFGGSMSNDILYEISKLEEENKELSRKIEDVKSEIELLTKDQPKIDMSDIDNLFKFEDKRIYWAPKIEALANLTPIEMALTEIKFDSKTLNLTAIIKFERGMDTEKTGVDLLEEIKKHSDINNNFTKIRLIESYTGEIQGQQVVFYGIEAKIKKTKKKDVKRKKLK